MILQASKRLRKFFNKELTDEIIWEQIIREGRLNDIHQLTRLSKEAAQVLIKNEKRMQILSLGIVELPAGVAEELAQYKGEKLLLNCVRTLGVDAAKALSGFMGGKISLNGLKEISLPLLGRLATYKGVLSLNGIEQMEIEGVDVRRAETVFKSLECSRLCLAGVKEPSLTFLKALSRFRGQLELSGIQALNEEEGEILSGFIGTGIFLDGVAVIKSSFASFFSHYQGYIDMSRAIVIEDKAIRNAASRPERTSRFSPQVKERIREWKEKELEQAREIKEQLVLDFSGIPGEGMAAKPANERVVETKDVAVPQEKGGDQQLLEEFAEFDEIKFTRVAADQQGWEKEAMDDPYALDEKVLENIELDLNQEIEKKKKRMGELLKKGYSNLLPAEKVQLEELREQVEGLKDNIRNALNVLVEQKELGTVIFTSSNDLALYLQEVDTADDHDALSRLDEEDFDMFGSNFYAGEEGEAIEIDEGTGFSEDSLNQGRGGSTPGEVEGDDFVFSFQ